jgi:NAD(P)H-nitrite reductase large subunit
MMNLDLRLETNVKMIDPKEQTIQIDKHGKEESIHYDSLVLATGGQSYIPRIKGYDKKGIYSLRTIDDGRLLQEAMRESKSAVVIGRSSRTGNSSRIYRKGIYDSDGIPQVCPAYSIGI